MGIHIALIEPEIPQNTGNIARTCAALNLDLHIVGTIPFVISERTVRRAGLDYWPYVRLHRYEDTASFFARHSKKRCIFTSSHAKHSYIDYSFPPASESCVLVFGKESTGLPQHLLKENNRHSIHIPLRSEVRSLNLANSVAILAYHVAAQHRFNSIL